jgi:long-chain acyl-CoA synthetase
VTGRIKEQYKLENGKYVFPAGIEEEIKLIPMIANAMIYGEGKPYNICLVYPDVGWLSGYASKHNLPSDPKRLIGLKEVQDLITTEIAKQLQGKYRGYEIPKKVVFLNHDFTLENGMLTQTMKVRRSEVIRAYRREIEEQY